MGKHAIDQPQTSMINRLSVHGPSTNPMPAVSPIKRVERKGIWKKVWHYLLAIKKFIVALVGAAITASMTAATTSGPPTLDNWRDWVPTAIAFLTALGVYGVRNKEQG